ncbi:MAG: hypothetical protein NVSMB19_09460 [Vulcanimicrobiaceae bacterium]
MRAFAALLTLVVAFTSVPARAARPLLDRHQWDAYFSLFARDVNVPWKATTVRLDTYSGAPVDFAAYNVDPADVVIAGAARTTRAVDTTRRKAVVRWRFSPPAGYRFETSDVAVPLGAQEGFYVVEARRGDAVQQVWINRTHLGILTKESPEGLLVWCVDLHSGRALSGVTVAFLVGMRLVDKRTDADGVIVWREPGRPAFALAEHGASRAFVSIPPQAPLPATIVGLRVESALVRAGERVRFVGFARKRSGAAYRRASGAARISLVARGRTLGTALARVDAAGAFAGDLPIPAGVDAGDYAILAAVAGGVGGTSVHVDAASNVALLLQAACPCDPERDVPLVLSARRAGAAAEVSARLTVVRTPHVVPPGAADDAPRWGTTLVYDRTVRTGPDGLAHVTLPAPSDGLDSTYGIRANARGASATARIVLAHPRLALALEPDAATADVGAPIAFDVRGFDPADGTPQRGLAIRIRLSHGASLQSQEATLDARGRAHVVFRQTSLGSNLALVEAVSEGRKVLDAAAVVVEPSALSGRVSAAQGDLVSVALDRARYRPGATIAMRASAPGATGDALVTLEGARTYVVRRASVSASSASAALPLGDAQGAVRVAAAFVRDGAIAVGSADVRIDGPGRARLTELVLDKAAYAPGETLHALVRDGGIASRATVALRLADGRASGAALFDDAPDLLRTGATSAQAPASDDPQWHAYVAPARSKASDIFAAERPRKAPTDVPSLGVAAPRTLSWRVARETGDALEVAVPKERGHYVLSILKIGDDGDVGAASASFNVQ